ncbi:hypothetical protein [Nonomuraea roseola]|uniref:Ankyrin repeat domain-containing protein n=1 Tax=Nonomuraea roseola TaxID=46179 RepID=A0ABV5Q529_9ACTN
MGRESTEVARAELDAVDAAVLDVARGRSTRTATVLLLLERGADPADRAFDEGPTPLDCALWGSRNNRADDGDHLGTVRALVAAGAPTRLGPPTGDEAIDALLRTIA